MSIRKKIVACLEHDLVRIICILMILVIPIVIIACNTNQEVNRPTHSAFIEDQEFISMVQNQLKEVGFEFRPLAGFELRALLNESQLQATATIDSGQIQFASDIILINEINGRKVVVISGGIYNSMTTVIHSMESLNMPDVARVAFINQHEIDVFAVLFNFGIAAWNPYEQKVQMDYLMDYHVRQIENLVKQLKALDEY